MESNTNNAPTLADFANLSPEKLQKLETVLTAILALPIARDTYAQIIDGVPTRTPYSDQIKACKSDFEKTIIVGDDSKPSDWAIQKFEEIRTTFTPQRLEIDIQLAQGYQSAPLRSSEHRLRLLEIAAASLHALAGMMYESFHPQTIRKPPEPPGGHFRQFHRTDHFYVDCYHTHYRQFENYPFGLLNVVGYWAEAELFGGVLLFERGESGSDKINAFAHPQLASRAFQVSDEQLDGFSNLGTSAGADTLLPFAQGPNARTELTFVREGGAPLRIYKNDYDKQPTWMFPERPSCVLRSEEGVDVPFDEAMKIVKEKAWDKQPQTFDAQSSPSFRRALGLEDDAPSDSKNDPSAGKRREQ